MRQTITFILITLSFVVSGQTDTARFRLSSCWINASYTYSNYSIESIKAQQSLSPHSELLRSTNGYYGGSSIGREPTINTTELDAMISFDLYSQRQKQYLKHWTFFTGIQGEKAWNVDFVYQRRSTSALYDTIYQTVYDGNMNPVADSIIRDTSTTSFIDFSWRQNMLALKTGVIFHTDERKLFSFGIGCFVAPGFFMKGNSDVYFSQNLIAYDTSIVTSITRIETINNSGTLIHEHSSSSEFYMRATFPVYVQFRLSRCSNFFNHLALTAELNPGVFYSSLKGVSRQITFQSGPSFGFKYYFNKSPIKWN